HHKLFAISREIEGERLITVRCNNVETIRDLPVWSIVFRHERKVVPNQMKTYLLLFFNNSKHDAGGHRLPKLLNETIALHKRKIGSVVVKNQHGPVRQRFERHRIIRGERRSGIERETRWECCPRFATYAALIHRLKVRRLGVGQESLIA